MSAPTLLIVMLLLGSYSRVSFVQAVRRVTGWGQLLMCDISTGLQQFLFIVFWHCWQACFASRLPSHFIKLHKTHCSH